MSFVSTVVLCTSCAKSHRPQQQDTSITCSRIACVMNEKSIFMASGRWSNNLTVIACQSLLFSSSMYFLASVEQSRTFCLANIHFLSISWFLALWECNVLIDRDFEYNRCVHERDLFSCHSVFRTRRVEERTKIHALAPACDAMKRDRFFEDFPKTHTDVNYQAKSRISWNPFRSLENPPGCIAAELKIPSWLREVRFRNVSRWVYLVTIGSGGWEAAALKQWGRCHATMHQTLILIRISELISLFMCVRGYCMEERKRERKRRAGERKKDRLSCEHDLRSSSSSSSFKSPSSTPSSIYNAKYHHVPMLNRKRKEREREREKGETKNP